MDSWIPGFLDSWIPGFIDSWISGFLKKCRVTVPPYTLPCVVRLPPYTFLCGVMVQPDTIHFSAAPYTFPLSIPPAASQYAFLLPIAKSKFNRSETEVASK